VFERNWIHHTGGDQGDGIEINAGSVGNAVRDNVIHDTKYPCIFVENIEAGPPNVIERNVCWGAKDNVVQINGNAIVRNNIFLGPGKAVLRLGPEGKPRPGPASTVKAFNNLVWSQGGEPAVSFAGDLEVVFANNIVDGGIIGKPKGLLTNNYWRREVLGENAVPGPPEYDAAAKAFYPLSDSLTDKGWGGDRYVPLDDFDGNARTGAPDVGPYERVGIAHSGWKISPGLKPPPSARPREGPGAISPASGPSKSRD
ncbi:MAG: right-handed parallel beta-helix repeat-containing protein, partial [Planctomycetota bacterium]|nr:right-handed parallel beta-helix repeat-containing protein [Planctomycetota bacterium]